MVFVDFLVDECFPCDVRIGSATIEDLGGIINHCKGRLSLMKVKHSVKLPLIPDNIRNKLIME